MIYEIYLEMAFERIINDRLPKTFKPLKKEEFYEWFRYMITPTLKTAELKNDLAFRLSYKKLYLIVRRLLEKSDSTDGKYLVIELDKQYAEVAKIYNLI